MSEHGLQPINDLIVAKVGTNVLATREEDGGEYLDREVFDNIGASILNAREAGKHVIIVSSAAIAAGMQETGTKPRPDKNDHMHELQYLSGVGWRLILNEWHRVLGGLSVVGIQITGNELEDDLLRSERNELLRTIHTALTLGSVPIINE